MPGGETHWTVLTEMAKQLPAFVMALVALLTILSQMQGLRKLIENRLDALAKKHNHGDQVVPPAAPTSADVPPVPPVPDVPKPDQAAPEGRP